MPQRSGSKKRQIDVQKQKLKASNIMTSKMKKGDFARKQAKPGRHLPVATNFTNTNFKTKQIALPSLKDNKDQKPETLEDFFAMLSKNLSGIKEKALEKILIYINSNKETLPGYCSDILKKVSSLLLENIYAVRQKAIKVILTCSSLLTESQFQGFLHLIELSIIPMMTHNVSLINRDSLGLLIGLLETQPTNIYGSTKILYKMLGLISVAHPNKKELSLKDVVDESVTADDWRREVFKCMKSFLTTILKNQQPAEMDDKMVCWNAEEPLYLPLYRNSGTELPKISYSWSKEDSYDNTKVLVQFLQKLLPLVGEALKGKFNTSRWKKYKTITGVNFDDERDILLLVEILNIVGQWVEQSKEKQNLETITDLLQKLCKYLMKGFPFEFSSQKTSSQLNLYICHLYSIFLLETPLNSPECQSCVVDHLMNMFLSLNAVPESSMFLILKFSRIFLSSEKFTLDFKNGLLFGLNGIMESKRFSKTAEDVCAFFIDLSLDTNFNYLSKTKAMSNWYKSIIWELDFIQRSNNVTDFNKKFLKYVRQVCAQKQPDFMQVLNQYPPSNLIDLLKYNNEDFQLAIIILISNINTLSPEFLQDLADLIHKKLLSEKTSQRLIYNLHSRFSRDAPLRQKLEFVKLLLNLACDTLAFAYQEEQYELDLETIKSFCKMQQGWTTMLVPKKSWRSHKKIFETCFDCLTSYLKDGIKEHVVEFITDLLYELGNTVPVHVAIAVLEIVQPIGFTDPDFASMMLDLLFHGMMYLCAATDFCGGRSDLLEHLSVKEVEVALHLDVMNRATVIRVVEDALFNGDGCDVSNDILVRAFRVVIYLVRRGIIRPRENEQMIEFAKKLHTQCKRSREIEGLFSYLCEVCRYV